MHTRPVESVSVTPNRSPRPRSRSRNTSSRGALAALALAAAALGPAWDADGVVRTWIGGNTTWTDNAGAANWSGGDEPDATDDALFDSANSVVLGSNQTPILSLTLTGGADLDTNGFDLDVDGPISISTASTSLIVSGATSAVSAFDITTASSGALTLDNGVVNMSDPGGVGLFSNGGLLSGRGTLNLGDGGLGAATILFDNVGTLSASAVGLVIIGNPPAGTLTINATADPANARIDLDGGPGNGVVNVNHNQTLDINVQLADAFNGDINLSRNARLDISTAWSFGSGGTIDVNNGAVGFPFPIPAGVAYIDGGAFTQTGGTITVAANDGTLQFDAPFTMTGGNLVNNGLVIFNANSTIDTGANFTMPTSSSSLTVEAGVTVTVNQGSFDVDGLGAPATNVVTINAGGLLDINGLDAGEEDMTNTFNLNGGTLDVNTDDNNWIIDGIVNVGANTGTSAINGDTLTLTSVSVNVGANASLDINAPTIWDATANLSVAAGASVVLDGTTTFSAPGSLAGAGTLVQSSALTVVESTTVSVATYDWDQGPTTVNSGVTFTINSTNIDVGNDTFNNQAINVNSGTLSVTVADGEWILGTGGDLNLTNTGVLPVLNGSRVHLQGTGRIDTSGSADINAAVTLDEGTVISMNTTTGTLTMDGAVELNGGDIVDTVNRALFNTSLQISQPLTVTGVSSINVELHNWDLDNTTVSAAGALSILSDMIESAGAQQYDSTITLNSGDLAVNIGTVVEWVMDGTLNMNHSTAGDEPTVSGDRILIGDDTGTADADLNVSGAGSSIISSQVVFNSDAQVTIAAGSTLVLDSTATFMPVNLPANGSFTGDGTLVTNGTVNVDEATTIDLTGGTVDLDGTDNIGNTINIDAPLVINAATMANFGKLNLAGTNILDVNNSVGTGVLTVNLDSAASEWTLNSQGVMNLVNDNSTATLLAGNAVNLNGDVNVTGDVRTTARVDIGSTAVIDILTAGQPFRLSGGNTTTSPNTITGGVINGPGLLGAETGSALHGFGTINADVDFDLVSNLRADNGTLTVNSTILDVNIFGTNDGDGILALTNPQTIASDMILELVGGNVTGAGLTNQGLIRGNGTIANNTVNTATGIIRPVGGTLRFTGINGANAGRIELNANTAEFNNALTNAVGGVITGLGTLRANSNLTNNGSIQVPGGGPTDFFGVITNTAGSSIAIAANGRPTFDSNVFVQAGAAVTAGAGSVNIFNATLNVSGTVTLANGVAGTSMAGLTINLGGSFDLANNRIAINYPAVSPAATIRGYILNGRLNSSMVAADPMNRLTIGYAEASDLGVLAWGAVAVDGTSLVIRPTYKGDANLNGQVDLDDFALIDLGFATGATVWSFGDFNHSGNVTVADYEIIDTVFVLQTGVIPAPSFLAMREAQFGPEYVARLIAAVPEPATALLYPLSALLVRRRRRNR